MDLGKKLSAIFIGLFLSVAVFANGTVFQAKELYNEMKLNGLIKYDVFVQGVEGFNKIDKKEKNILTIVDFSLPSTEKRMYVLDLERRSFFLNLMYLMEKIQVICMQKVFLMQLNLIKVL